MRRLDLWRVLESTPILSGVKAVWQEATGSEFPILEPFLKPTGDRASTYPCPEPGNDGCPRGVVIHSPDDIMAVCRRNPRSCESLKLAPDDIVIYKLDVPRLATHASAFFGLGGEGSPLAVAELGDTYYLGTYRPVAGLSFPAYLTIQHDREDFSQTVERLVARDGRSFILIAPTTDLLEPACAEMMRTRSSLLLGMADFTMADKNGELTAEKPAEELLQSFRDSVINTAATETKNGMLFFQTPPDATWSDVEIRFKDGYTVSIQVLDKRAVFNYTQMGMASRKNAEPTRQWKLLQSFAEQHGVLTWDSSHADRKNQKRRELLARNLQTFFRIEKDPITLTEDGKGWKVLFSLHPES